MPPKKYPPIEPREPDDDNVVREAQSQGQVRPDGPGDATAPVKPKDRDVARARAVERKPPVKPKAMTKTTTNTKTNTNTNTNTTTKPMKTKPNTKSKPPAARTRR